MAKAAPAPQVSPVPEPWSDAQWAEYFKASHSVPVSRDAALRDLITDCQAVAKAAAASVSDMAAKLHVTKVLTRLSEIRAVSLGRTAWQVEVMQWLAAQPQFIDEAVKHRTRR